MSVSRSEAFVMGYQISVIWGDGKTGIHGSTGEAESMPAFSLETALAYLAELSKKESNISPTLQSIVGARYVQLTSGEVVDNGPKKPHSSS
ncbi:MAG: hypothetical protein AAB612_00370 [Patescibacteria group bacterium]